MQRHPTKALIAASLAAIAVVAASSPGEASKISGSRKPSLRQLAGQRIVYGFDGTSAPQELLDRVHNREAAGVIIHKRNIPSRDQLRGLDQSLPNARPPHQPPGLVT